MANKSAEYPMGRLNGEILKSFFSITGSDGDFTYTPGHERIPENWYTRNLVDYYTIPYYSIDANTMALAYPEFLSVGGNTGTVNSFVGLDPANLTGGVYDAETLTEGNNALCYGFQVGVQALPDLLEGLFTDVDAAADAIGAAVNQATDSLGCPQLNTVVKGQFDQYPGYAKLKSDGTY